MYSIIRANSGAFPIIDDLYLIDADVSDAVARADAGDHCLYQLRLKMDTFLLLIDVHLDEEQCTIFRSDGFSRYTQAVRVITKNHPRWCATLAGWIIDNINKSWKIEHEFERIDPQNIYINPLPARPAVWYYDSYTDSTIIVQA